MSERARHSKKTSWRDTDPEWCGQDDKTIIARNRRRYYQAEIDEGLEFASYAWQDAWEEVCENRWCDTCQDYDCHGT